MVKLGCVLYGEQLIKTQDLDPVYVILNDCPIFKDKNTLRHWLLAYWAFYHMGTASWITDGVGRWPNLTTDEYWNRFMEAASSKSHLRCPERRHFRGKNAISSTKYLRERGIDSLFNDIEIDGSCSDVMKQTQKWKGFGPWIGFKIADMLERLQLASISFSVKDVYLFDSPLEGAKRLRESVSATVNDSEVGAWAVDYLIQQLGHLKAPPLFERNVSVQEVETVLCKWKSYTNNKYHIGEDIISCRKSLKLYQNRSPLAQELIRTSTI